MKKMIMTIAILLAITPPSYALNTATHQLINENIAKTTMNGFSLDIYLKDNLGIQNGINTVYNSSETHAVWEWIRIGGLYEDAPPSSVPFSRSLNHFHNPLILNWNEAGFHTWWASGSSAILWAQGPQYTSTGDWSWRNTRNNYYLALTLPNSSDRDSKFADTFRGLGQVMHLVQDMSVPEHTRNEAHGFGGYEGWVSKHPPTSTNTIFFTGTIYDIPSFFDTDQYVGTNPQITLSTTIGLSEYTNANFFGPNTIFSEDKFPNPSKVNTTAKFVETMAEDGQNDQTCYVYPLNQDYKLAHCSYWVNYKQLSSTIPGKWLYDLDDNVYSDYASLLLPRAIGYSAQLLQYFFRGQINLIPTDSTGSRFAIINNSKEDMNGRFELYYDQDDGSENGVRTPVPLPIDSLIIAANSSSDSFSFSWPSDAKSGSSFILVFTGTMGNENGAVVGNLISNPWIDITDSTWWDTTYAGSQQDWYGTYNNGIWTSGYVELDLVPFGFHWSDTVPTTGWWDADAWAKDLRFTKFKITYSGSPDWLNLVVGCDDTEGPHGLLGDLFLSNSPADFPSGVEKDVVWLPPHNDIWCTAPNDFNFLTLENIEEDDSTGQFSISKFEIYVPQMTNNLRQWILNHPPVDRNHDNINRGSGS